MEEKTKELVKVEEKKIQKKEQKSQEKEQKSQEKQERDVEVNITPIVYSSDGKDLTKVCLLITEAATETPLLYTTESSFLEDIEEAGYGLVDKQKVMDRATSFFSSASNQRKRDVLIGCITSSTDLESYFEISSSNDLYYFGFLVAEKRAEITNFEEMKTYTNSKGIFLVCLEEETIEENLFENEDYLIQISHNQQDTGGTNTPAGIQDKVMGILAKQMEVDPNYNTYAVLQGISGLKENTYFESKRTLFEGFKINQYFKRNGLTRFRLGVANSGKKIEEVYIINKYIPFTLQNALEVWQENIRPRVGDLGIFQGKLREELTQYEEQGFLTPSELLNNKSFVIDTVEADTSTGIAEFKAEIRICYNNNIVNIKINGTQVSIN